MHKTASLSLSLPLLLSLSSACSLIKVNGKPLGGSSPSATSTEPVSDADSSGGSNGFETGEQYQARRDQESAAEERAAPKAPAGRPEWCDAYVGDSENVDLADFQNLEAPGRDWQLVAIKFAGVMCTVRGEHRELRPKVMALRGPWMKQHGLDESDLEVVVAERKGRGWDRQSYEALGGPVSQIDDASPLQLDVLGPKASMLMRVATVAGCAKQESLLRQIQCAQEPIDAAKAYAEIEHTPKLNIQTRYHLRQFVKSAVEDQARARIELAAKAKEEPGIGKLVAIARAQHEEWATPNATRDKLVGLLATIETATAANKRSAFAGCPAATAAATAVWTDAVRSAQVPKLVPGATNVFETMIEATFRTPEPYLAYQVLKLCAAGTNVEFAPKQDFVGSDIRRRGPRTSMIAAWAAVEHELTFDDRELTMRELLAKVSDGGGARSEFMFAGTIERVAPKDGRFEVSFKPEMAEREECLKDRETDRIERISDGNFHYARECVARGRVKYDKAPGAFLVSPFFAQGLQPGMYLRATAAMPIAATAGAKSSTVTWLFGVPLTR
ncbi:MAG: hypothetical protein IPQ07_23875 [Myxococcales bacterium]|nr:hypothetical protein [Myxococcales bacterium]